MQDTELTAHVLAALAAASALAWCGIFACWLRGKRLVPYEPRRQVPWNGVDVAVVICSALIMLGIGGQMALRYFEVDPSDKSDPHYLQAMLISASVAEVFALLSSVVYLLGRGFGWQSLGIGEGRTAHDILVGIIAALAVDFPLLMLQGLLTQFWPSKHPLIELIREHPSKDMLAPMAILAVLLAPALEELIFRVLIQGWLEKLIRKVRRTRMQWRALQVGAIPIVVSASLFAVVHAHGPDPIPIFLLGLALGYVYHQTHRILPSLVLHACFNGATVLLLAASLK